MAYGPIKLKMKDEFKIREQKTNTTLFIMPVFKVPLLKLEEYGFIDAYLYDKDRVDTEPDGKTIYALFHPDETQLVELQKQIEDWDNNSFLIGDYDYEGGYVVVELRFPNEFRDQYKLFIKGKYSQFSELYQENMPRKVTSILATGDPYEADSLQFLIINKRVKLKNYWEELMNIELDKDDEYWSKPIILTETLDIVKVIEEQAKKNKKDDQHTDSENQVPPGL